MAHERTRRKTSMYEPTHDTFQPYIVIAFGRASILHIQYFLITKFNQIQWILRDFSNNRQTSNCKLSQRWGKIIPNWPNRLWCVASISLKTRNFSFVLIRDKSEICFVWVCIERSLSFPDAQKTDPILSRHQAQTMAVCYSMNSEPLIELITVRDLSRNRHSMLFIPPMLWPSSLPPRCHSILSVTQIRVEHNLALPSPTSISLSSPLSAALPTDSAFCALID